MFNLKSQKTTDKTDFLKAEMKAFDIVYTVNGYHICIGDEALMVSNLQKCNQLIHEGILELKKHLYDSWNDLQHISQKMLSQNGQNSGSLDNLLFLNAIKKSFQLSNIFEDLKPISDTLQQLLDTDIQSSDDQLIRHFNDYYLRIKCLHKLVLTEIYRQKLINCFLKTTKQAQISGPWANLDLPMEERVWDYDEAEEDYFQNRKKSRRAQTRYNPENQTKSGFYYVWNDLSTAPYKFTDRETDSPYKSRGLLSVP